MRNIELEKVKANIIEEKNNEKKQEPKIVFTTDAKTTIKLEANATKSEEVNTPKKVKINMRAN